MRSISPELALTLCPTRLRGLLEVFGAPRDVSPHDPPWVVARALFEGRASRRLERAWDDVARFASQAGHRAIVEAARACKDARAVAWYGETPAHLAADLVIERATSHGKARRAVARILAMAPQRLERRLPDRPTYEL